MRPPRLAVFVFCSFLWRVLPASAQTAREERIQITLDITEADRSYCDVLKCRINVPADIPVWIYASRRMAAL
jgi:hypothetical protein